MRRVLTIILLITLASSVSAQYATKKLSHRNSFDFALRGGISFCQIDGDRSGNFNKVGYDLGVNTSFPVNHSGLRFLIEIGLFNKGSYVDANYRQISLHYIQVPLMFIYDFKIEDVGKFRVGAGFAPAFLGYASVLDNEEHVEAMENNFRSFDRLPLFLNFEYRINKQCSFQVRYSNSMLPITYEAPNGTYRITRSNKGAFNRCLSAGISLNFLHKNVLVRNI